MRFLTIVLQVLGVLAVVLASAILTLRWDNRNADGPSILFPGGTFTSGEVYSGPEPDWRFTDGIGVVELQIDDPPSSRRTFIMESDGRIYVPSGYMKSFLGRIWKDWAFQADERKSLGEVRIDGIRYPRKLVRIEEGEVLDGIARKLAEKYGGGASEEAVRQVRASVEEGSTWIFELAPRDAGEGVGR